MAPVWVIQRRRPCGPRVVLYKTDGADTHNAEYIGDNASAWARVALASDSSAIARVLCRKDVEEGRSTDEMT